MTSEKQQDHIPDIRKKVYVAKRSVINTGIWVEADDDAATLGQLEIMGVAANDYYEGAILIVTCQVAHPVHLTDKEQP
jgi:hypothetical protein